MIITYENTKCIIPDGSTVREGFQALGLQTTSILAALRGGQVLEMNEVIPGDGELLPLTLSHEEGRRIYERSLRFVMLLAAKHLMPGKRVRVEYSAAGGVLVRLPGENLTAEQVDTLEQEMRRIVEQNLPFEKEEWLVQDAMDYFAAEGQQDKVALLKLRPFRHFKMYRCGDMWEYFYGAMAPSTGSVKVFDLLPHDGGFVLQLPDKSAFGMPSIYHDYPKHLSVFAESAEWCRILGIENASDLTSMMNRGDMRTFIRVNEALQDKALADIADEIDRRKKRVILLAGPSSSGKTTTAARLAIQLRVLGYHPMRLSLDDYYRNQKELPREADGSVDLESIHTLDLPLIQQQICSLLQGEATEIPIFNFKTHEREPHGVVQTLGQGEPIIIEGIHGLNPMLSQGIPAKETYRIFVSALTCLNLDDHNRIRTTDARLLRRIVRDHQFRNTSPSATLNMWQSVRNGENRWIFPYQETADRMFNTTLHYELPFLKTEVYDLLEAIPPTEPCYLPAKRLLKVLHYIPFAPKEMFNEIPPISILREFIGNSTFDLG
jgi:uridine kinase